MGKKINKKCIDIIYGLFRTEYVNIIWFLNEKIVFYILINRLEVMYVLVLFYLNISI